MLDASTFKNLELINLSKEHFISLKIDAESEYGRELFMKFDGCTRLYKMIIFFNLVLVYSKNLDLELYFILGRIC